MQSGIACSRIRLLRAATTLLVCLLAAKEQPACAAKPHPARTHEYKHEIQLLEAEWRTAQLADDTAAMDRLLADDYVGISINGQVYTKAQQLERMRDRTLLLTKFVQGEIRIKLAGQLAIVTSSAEVEGSNDRTEFHGQYSYMRIWQRDPNGAWKITSFEATRKREHGEGRSGGEHSTELPQPTVKPPEGQSGSTQMSREDYAVSTSKIRAG